MKENKKRVNLWRAFFSKKKALIWKTPIIIIVFILGLGIFSYPIIGQIVYDRAAKREIQDYDGAVAKIDDTEIKKELELAYAYNDYLAGESNVGELKDPYTQEETNAGVEEYIRMLKVNEEIGHIIIPKINLDAPMYAGTSSEVLNNGIGHMEGTSLPVGGNNTHTVLTGHRGLPTAKLFTDLDKMEIDDKFYIKMIGGTLAYEVDQIKVVEPTDFRDVAIVPGHDYCTLLTCTPYMINSHRLLVRGHRIDYDEEAMEKDISVNNTDNLHRKLFFGILVIVIIILSYILLKYLQNKRLKKIQLEKERIQQEKNKEIE